MLPLHCALGEVLPPHCALGDRLFPFFHRHLGYLINPISWAVPLWLSTTVNCTCLYACGYLFKTSSLSSPPSNLLFLGSSPIIHHDNPQKPAKMPVSFLSWLPSYYQFKFDRTSKDFHIYFCILSLLHTFFVTLSMLLL